VAKGITFGSRRFEQKIVMMKAIKLIKAVILIPSYMSEYI